MKCFDLTSNPEDIKTPQDALEYAILKSRLHGAPGSQISCLDPKIREILSILQPKDIENLNPMAVKSAMACKIIKSK